MFQTWRLKLREAEDAHKAGDLARARKLLVDEGLTEFLPGKRLATRVARDMVDHIRSLSEEGELDAGWRELEAIKELAGDGMDASDARDALIQGEVARVERSLRSGDATNALRQLDGLDRRRVNAAALPELRQVAARLQSSNHLQRHGKFREAKTALTEAQCLRPDLFADGQHLADCQEKLKQCRTFTEKLHRAMTKEEWTEAVSLAESLLELAPESKLAQDARRHAWAKVGAKLESRVAVTAPWTPSQHGDNNHNGSTDERGPRFQLWVDGVGGYLVCLSDDIVVGQAAPGNNIDVPILGDLSRRHVRIRREGEGYSIEPLHVIRINGKATQTKTRLCDGDEIELGTGVRCRFRQPHALSASARLDLLSRHRTQPYADGVLLMAESCVLGPKYQNHVVCRDWESDVVLYRQDDELYCRAMDDIEIDGQLCDGQGRVNANSHVVGSDFSMSLEELDRCTSQPLL